MYDFDLEHPDVASAQRTGYGCGAAQENVDTAETRREFAQALFPEFLAFAQDGDPDLLEHFVEHYRWKYRDFLN